MRAMEIPTVESRPVEIRPVQIRRVEPVLHRPAPRSLHGRGGWTIALVVALALAVVAPAAAAEEGIAEHPDELTFPPLDFEVPDAEQYRHVLSNGNVVYVVEDRTLPLFTVGVRLKVGSFLEPAAKTGLAAMTGRMMRLGGAGELEGTEFDERAAFLAANISSAIGATTGRASVNCLTSQRSECLDLFFDMMRRPAFGAARLVTEKQNRLEELRQRNDDPASIAAREFRWLLYGDEHFAGRLVTGDSLDAIERQDLVDFHRKWWHPATMVWTVSGDVDTEEILAVLEERVADWPTEGAEEPPWPPPEPRHGPVPGVYVVEKDIPQGRVQIGSLTAKREDWMAKDAMAATLMNQILGGGGFASRLTKRIRSDEGLAYSAGSSFSLEEHWPGQFVVFYQSKSETVALAAAIAFEELERIVSEEVSEEELRTAKGSLRDSFPQNFDSPSAVAAIFASDEILGRPHEYWTTYQDRVDAVTRDDVLAAAREYLSTDQMVFLVVGDWDEIREGDADERATMEQFFEGAVTVLPQRDPVSLEPVAADG